MNYKSFLHLWITILFSNSLTESVESVTNLKYKACAPTNCGTGPNISYPFMKEDGEPYCGLEGFKIKCKESKPFFLINKAFYFLIKDISYENHSFQLIPSNDNEIVDASCVEPNVTFDLDRNLTYSSSHSNVMIFYRCRTTSFLTDLDQVPLVRCPSSSNSTTGNSFVALVPNDKVGTLAEDSRKHCESQFAVPVDLNDATGSQTIRTVNYTELLTKGFSLTWNELYNDQCSKCKRSGGRCGIENGISACYCPHSQAILSSCAIEPEATNITGKPGTNSSVIKAPTEKPGNRSAVKALIDILIGGIGVVILFVILILCCLRKKSSTNLFILRWNQKKKKTMMIKMSKTQQNVEAFLSNYGPLQVRRYSYSDVTRIINNNNSFPEKLGRGGFGEVYKGKLDNGCDVAVKILNDSRNDDDDGDNINGENFINEVATMSKTSHVNIITLLGFCFEDSKRALIYEFMPNGSLEKFIFDKSPTEKRTRLGWDMLYQISLGIARGLEYLHRGCNTRILHFDIKPHNILLDHNFVPKITDFGLAKICSRAEGLVSSMMGPRGTAGYIAPEIFSRSFGGVSHKSDVYSYGMMVLDMIGGRDCGVTPRSDNYSYMYFPHWIYQRVEWNEGVGFEQIMDEEDRVKVEKMITVSLWCIQIGPDDRPSMSEVIEMLEVMSLGSLPIPPPKPFLSSPSTTEFCSSTRLLSSSQ